MTETKQLPIIPLKEIVVFPSSITPLFIVRHKSLLALDAALNSDKQIFLLSQKNLENEHPGPEDLFEVGTCAEVIQVLRLPDGSAKILVEGSEVCQVVQFDTSQEYLVGEVSPFEHVNDNNKRTAAMRRTIENQFEAYSQFSDKIPNDLAMSISSIEEPLQLANAIANYCHFKTTDKQRVLEARSVSDKLKILSEMLGEENELLELENKIISQVKGKIGKTQKEYFLNEQLKVIEKELGMGSEEDLELEELEHRIVKSEMSEEATIKATRELQRLSRMPGMSPEATVSRTYIEWLLDLPWNKFTNDQPDLLRAQKILDTDHFGLKKIKERIIEYLAVLKLVDKYKGQILCLVGPPGVGKTSLGRSIARTLKRKFVRISLGGVRDEAEIRGHRRTYIGSLPGKIIQQLKKAGSMNPVMLLDEVDKMGSDFRGDPAAALLEVLDPEINREFNDHYLEIDFDLSSVMFITTANTLDGIPEPLLDRMELIRLPGYTEDEKRSIARGFLVPRQLKAHGLKRKQALIEMASIDYLIQRYTREAGVRNLEREIATLCRKVAKLIVEKDNLTEKYRITPEFVREHLGPERHSELQVHGKTEVGVATGLAWTEVGGEILPTETTIMTGKGEIQLTGLLGEVMQESAKAALSYLRSRYKEYNLDEEFYKDLDIHVHLPEGGIPKDGPSAGVTLITSMLSALTRRPVRQDMAMTGEITLRGQVLKIGGLKEKVIAAHRHKIRQIIIPRENVGELEEIADDIRKVLDFHPVSTIDEVIALALVPEQKQKKSRKSSAPAPKKNKPSTRRKRPGTHQPRA
jgi:ATP-dependent Lon protease